MRTPFLHNPSECSAVRNLLSDYHDNLLSVRKVWVVEKHLARCKECQQVRHEMTETIHLVRSAPKHDTRSDFMAKLHSRLDTIEPTYIPQLSFYTHLHTRKLSSLTRTHLLVGGLSLTVMLVAGAMALRSTKHIPVGAGNLEIIRAMYLQHRKPNPCLEDKQVTDSHKHTKKRYRTGKRDSDTILYSPR